MPPKPIRHVEAGFTKRALVRSVVLESRLYLLSEKIFRRLPFFSSQYAARNSQARVLLNLRAYSDFRDAKKWVLKSGTAPGKDLVYSYERNHWLDHCPCFVPKFSPLIWRGVIVHDILKEHFVRAGVSKVKHGGVFPEDIEAISLLHYRRNGLWVL